MINKTNKMLRASSTHGIDVKFVQNFVRYPERKRSLSRIGSDYRMILKWI
jgi:hypothetical protein